MKKFLLLALLGLSMVGCSTEDNVMGVKDSKDQISDDISLSTDDIKKNTNISEYYGTSLDGEMDTRPDAWRDLKPVGKINLNVKAMAIEKSGGLPDGWKTYGYYNEESKVPTYMQFQAYSGYCDDIYAWKATGVFVSTGNNVIKRYDYNEKTGVGASSQNYASFPSNQKIEALGFRYYLGYQNSRKTSLYAITHVESEGDKRRVYTVTANNSYSFQGYISSTEVQDIEIVGRKMYYSAKLSASNCSIREIAIDYKAAPPSYTYNSNLISNLDSDALGFLNMDPVQSDYLVYYRYTTNFMYFANLSTNTILKDDVVFTKRPIAMSSGNSARGKVRNRYPSELDPDDFKKTYSFTSNIFMIDVNGNLYEWEYEPLSVSVQ